MHEIFVLGTVEAHYHLWDFVERGGGEREGVGEIWGRK